MLFHTERVKGDSMKKIGIMKQKDRKCLKGQITVDGKQKSVYGRNISEVNRKIKEIQYELAKGNVISKAIRLETALEDYLFDIKQSKLKAISFDRVESTFKHHIKNEPLGKMQLGSVATKDIQKLLAKKCREGLSVSSIKKIYNLLNEFFRYATATREISYNPMLLVDMPHSSQILHKPKEMEVLTQAEVKHIISVAEQTDKNGKLEYRYGEAIVLLILTGIRSCELRPIRKSDIDFEKGILKISQSAGYAKDRIKGGITHNISEPKTEKSKREIPLNNRALLAVKRLMETTYDVDTGYLLCTQKSKIVTHNNLLRCFNAMLSKAEISCKGLHSTRHTFATMILKQAEDKGQIKEVSELLGHSQVSTTYKFYIKTSNEDKRSLVDQLNMLAV